MITEKLTVALSINTQHHTNVLSSSNAVEGHTPSFQEWPTDDFNIAEENAKNALQMPTSAESYINKTKSA